MGNVRKIERPRNVGDLLTVLANFNPELPELPVFVVENNLLYEVTARVSDTINGRAVVIERGERAT